LLKDGVPEKTPEVVRLADETLKEIEDTTLPAVRQSHDNDQTLLDSAFNRYSMVSAYHEGRVTREEQLREADRTASAQHKTCRANEVPLYEQYTTCEAQREALWAEYIRKHALFQNGGLCETGFGEDQDTVDESAYGDLVQKGQSSFEALQEHEVKKKECQAKKLTYDLHRAVCDGQKVHLEDAVCESHSLRMESYQEMHEWWDEVDASYSDVRTAVEENAQVREQEVRALIEVKCLLNTIHDRGGKACEDSEDSTVTATIKACQDADEDQVEGVKIDAKDPPARPSPTASAPHPCSGDFLEAEYSGADIQKLPALPACQPCTLRNAGLKRGALCAGTTPVGNTDWQVYNERIFVDVDTSVCGFTETPQYFSALQGTTSHWTSKGRSEIYGPTATGFRVYIYIKVTPAEANSRKYAIHWIAGSAEQPVEGVCEGQAAGWTKHHKDMFQTVDTSACNFAARPVYVTSMQGKSSHWTSTGSSEVYSATANKFTQYIDGSDPDKAAANEYKTNYIAVDASSTSKGACAGRTSENDWREIERTSEHDDGIYVDVDTSKCGFEATPVYVTSLHGTSSHWSSTGSSELYSPTATGFRIYIATTNSVVKNENYKEWKWQIEWVAVAEV
jgi:ribosomal protein S11